MGKQSLTQYLLMKNDQDNDCNCFSRCFLVVTDQSKIDIMTKLGKEIITKYGQTTK